MIDRKTIWLLLLTFIAGILLISGCGKNSYEDSKTGLTVRELGSDLDKKWAVEGVVVEQVKPGSKTAGIINAGELVSYIVDERQVKTEKEYRNDLYEALKEDERAVLGLLKVIPASGSQEFGIQVRPDSEERGVIVNYVKAGSGPDSAGVKMDAVINSINGKAVKNVDDYEAILNKVLASSGQITLSMLKDISAPKLRELGIDEVQNQPNGVKIVKMEEKPEGTPASMEGIKVGDVITSVIDEIKITGIKSYKKAIKKASDADRVIFKRGELGGVKLVVMEALGKIGDPKAVEPLLKALGSKDKWIRRAAAEALQNIDDERIIQPLMWHLVEANESDTEVRRSAARALARMQPVEAIDSLAQALRDSSLGVRLEASYALARMGDSAIQVLVDARHDPDSKVRDSAVAALGNIGNRQARDELINVLRDETEESTVKLTAIQGLSKIGDSESMAELRRLANYGDPGLKAFISEILTAES